MSRKSTEKRTKVIPRAWTAEEMRAKLIGLVWVYIKEWEGYQGKTTHERMTGLAFSLLALLDGSNPSFPGCLVIPSPHEDDEEYLRKQGENWFPSINIGIGLHEIFHRHAMAY